MVEIACSFNRFRNKNIDVPLWVISSEKEKSSNKEMHLKPGEIRKKLFNFHFFSKFKKFQILITNIINSVGCSKVCFFKENTRIGIKKFSINRGIIS